MTIDEQCQKIIENAPTGISDDKKMRYVYWELGKILSKSVEFFYDKENTERLREIYDNYQAIEDDQAICKNTAYKLVELANKLGLSCKMIEINNNQEFTHWSVEYSGDNNKRYMINPVPDFYRVQLGFSTKSFCSASKYPYYVGEPFDTMSEEYLREMDTELGYLPGEMYTEEVLKKLQSHITNGIGKHVTRTSAVYQEFYLKLLDMIKEDTLTLEEKLNQIKPFDPNFEKHKGIFKECLTTERVTKAAKKIINRLAIKSLTTKEPNLDRKLDGAKYIGDFNVNKMKDMQKEILIYKFNYMIECLPQLTSNLTGFIENKNFFDEVKKYIFKKGREREAIHRHTVTCLEDDKKEYYMMFSLKIDKDSEEKVYCFYNHKTKECRRNIEPIDFMLQNGLTPLKGSTLNVEIDRALSLGSMLDDEKDLSVAENLTQSI